MLEHLHVTKKASIWTPFLFIVLALFSPLIFANNCAVKQFHETAQVAHVYDGDTIKLVDGRKLRLIGINTPERGRDGKEDEPFYNEAKNQLQQIIDKNNGQIKIVIGKEKHDRYKRLLAHPFTLQGKNISSMLLKKGMGFSIAIPPNIQFVSCYQNAEKDAKTRKQGIWNHPFSHPIQTNQISKKTLGFHQVKGRVQRIGESRSSYWLNLSTGSKSRFALRILKKDLAYFTLFHPKDLLHKQLTARGWIYKIKGEQRMTIRHPNSLHLQNAD